jgi:phosphoribosylanthranilate isomerase
VTRWIKICGMTTPEGVAAALEARVDAIGFVFAESVRRLTLEVALQLAAPARGRTLVAAVTLHPTQQWIDEIVQVFKPDVLQADVEDLGSLRLPRHLGVLPVFRQRQAEDSQLPGRLLFEGPSSGSGRTGDWQGASGLARRTQLILAGGLNASNVGAAIEQVQPFGVDVSSGVEQRPGVKSPDRIAAFVAAVRALDPSEQAQACTTGDSI